MNTVDLIEKSHGKLCILIGSRPGASYASLTNHDLLHSADCKVQAVEAFVKRHNPDIVFTIAGMNSEAESFGARVVMSSGSPVVDGSPLGENPHPSQLITQPLEDSPLCHALIESIRLLSERYPEKMISATLNGPLTVLGQLLGLDRLLILSIDNPELTRRLLEPITRRIVELMNAQMEAGATYVHVAEPTGSLLSPKSFREIDLPSLQHLFSQVHVPNHMHMCGDVNGHLDELAQTGAGAISVDSMVDMKEASGRFGKHMAVFGNIESAGVLLHGSPRDVEQSTLSMLKRMSSVSNYAPASSCGIPAQTPPENIDAFVKTVQTNN